MKISEKVYMHITYSFIEWNPHWPLKHPQSETGTSYRVDDNLLVHVGHYLQGGQVILRLFSDLSLYYAPHAPHEII